MNAFRTGCIFTGSILLSFAAGWYLHQPQNAPVPETPKSSASTIVLAAQPKAAVVPVKVEPPAAIAGKESPYYSERRSTLRWLKEQGLLMPVRVFDQEGISPQFALLYGLTPAEKSQLSQSFQQAKQRLEELASQRAQVDSASTAEKLIVSVPAFPNEGGRVYNDLLANFASVMGADRYALFNETSGNLLENSLEGMGLATNRYEVTLRKTAANEQPTYEIKRSFTYPTAEGTSSGSSNSIIHTGEIGKFFPLLKSYALPNSPASSP